ncbi:hypothetical protein BDQ17DRAFT_166626 [Cyathus striatus]|nr:hypothetical protein BDQ17DRAFT_166626 [Cyathus striatus]
MLGRHYKRLFIHPLSANHHHHDNPSSRVTSSCAFTTQVITLPDIPELFDPNSIEVLLSTKDVHKCSTLAPTNPMIEALKETATQVYTTKMARDYHSTGSTVLDTLQFIGQHSIRSGIAGCLSNAWKEEPSPQKVIWDMRSIHDGGNNKKLFHRTFGRPHDNHSRITISNLRLFVEPACAPPKNGLDAEGPSHGFWKDLLDIICLAARHELHERSPIFLHSTLTRRRLHPLVPSETSTCLSHAALQHETKKAPSVAR